MHNNFEVNTPMFRFFKIFVALFLPYTLHAGVVSVEFKDKGFMYADGPTQTFVWPAKKAKATLISFLEGREGWALRQIAPTWAVSMAPRFVLSAMKKSLVVQ